MAVARFSVLLAVAGGIIAVLGGLLVALGLLPEADPGRNEYVDPCPEPPCFGGGPAPTLADVPVIAHVFLLGGAFLVALVAVIAAVKGLITSGERRGLLEGAWAAAGAAIVLIGGELVPHGVNPCITPELLGLNAPGFCESETQGGDVPGAWHALWHGLVGFLPLSLFVWWAHRKISKGN